MCTIETSHYTSTTSQLYAIVSWVYVHYISIMSPSFRIISQLYPHYTPIISLLYKNHQTPPTRFWLNYSDECTNLFHWLTISLLDKMTIYIPWWSPFHSILSFLLVNSPNKMVVKPRVSPKTCRLRLGNCSHVRWWGWRRLAHLDSEIWLDLWDAISPMGSIWPWKILEKIGNSYGTVGGQVRLFFIMFTIVYSLWNHRHSPAPIIRFLNRSIGHPQVMA